MTADDGDPRGDIAEIVDVALLPAVQLMSRAARDGDVTTIRDQAVAATHALSAVQTLVGQAELPDERHRR
jgi:hypothetical protein